MEKKNLTVVEQIEHLKNKGITFNTYSEEDAIEYLNNNQYFFKLTAYRKNYPKDVYNKYINLDFGYLVNIATIDMYIRYLFMQMCLDIEHFTKVKLIKAITESSDEDGYSIIRAYKSDSPDQYKQACINAQNGYCKDLFESKKNNLPIWAFVEFVSFSNLCYLYKFAGERINNKNMVVQYYILNEVRKLRNACAHNNCILNDLEKHPNLKYTISHRIKAELGKISGLSSNSVSNKLSNPKISQIVSLLYLYRNFVTSSKIKDKTSERLHELFSIRVYRDTDYLNYSILLQSFFEFINKIIDNWY